MYYSSRARTISFEHITEGAKMAVEAKTATDLEQERMETEAKVENAKRTGISTRVFVGRTRGKGSQVVKWEAFDHSIPESLPKLLQEFVDFTGAKESDVLNYAIDGYNEANQTAASDPISEHVNPEWSPELAGAFRIVVRNYVKGLKDMGMTLDEAVASIKPNFDKQHLKTLAASQQASAK